MNKHQKTIKTLEKNTWKDSLLLVLEGAVVGILAGLIAVLYRYCLSFAEKGLYATLDMINGNVGYILLWFVALILMAFLVTIIVKWEGMSAGSGIPQVSGEIRGYLHPCWWRVIVAKIVGGTTCILGGLSLGREGPSIQLGAMIAKGFSKVRKHEKTKEIAMLSCGAGAGLAAAFNAPLAGIIFILEELHHNFNKTMLVAGLVATVTADYVSKMFFGQAAVFSYGSSTLPLKYYWLLIIFGILLGLCGAGYNAVMVKTQGLFQRLTKVPKFVKILIPFLLAGGLGLVLPQVLAGGHSMVLLLEHARPTLIMLVILLVVKFLFSAISFGSGVPGGIFFPLLILGSYVGAIFGDVAIGCFPISEDLWYQFIILGMAGLFAGIVRAPITGIVLITEMTGNMERMLDIAVVSILAYVVANMVGSKPIYSSLLENILRQQDIEETDEGEEQILVTYVVPFDSDICHKTICEIDWRHSSLVASIEREERAITPRGNTTILPGDHLMVLIDRKYFAEDNAYYEKMIDKECSH